MPPPVDEELTSIIRRALRASSWPAIGAAVAANSESVADQENLPVGSE
jgi:hypothetical protein